MAKTDLKREIPAYSARRGRFDLVTVAPAQFLMVDGQGDPNVSPAYRSALAALYPIAWTLKFFSKTDLGRDHVVMPLEGLWWADDMETFTARRDKSAWSWTMMILVPDWITQEHVTAAIESVRAKAVGGSTPEPAPALDAVRLEPFAEGLCMQTLHVGPYDEEGPTLARLHDQEVPGRGLRMHGRHHEIYLGDPRRTAPDRLRTILRQPVAPAN